MIYLVGFMASGKSTVGPELAARLGRPFIDLDLEIEREAGCAIARLIERDGEESFRRAETLALQKASSGGPSVIAPGGGAVTREENRRLMAACGVVVWLDAPFELCWERILRDVTVRPLAPNQDAARQRYEQRLLLYRESGIRVEITGSRTPGEIAESIVDLLAGRER